MAWLQNKFEKNFLITTVDYVFNWARKSAVWPMTSPMKPTTSANAT